ncbi:endolysin [Vibrio phage K373]
MEYQKETTHVNYGSERRHEYYYNGAIWRVFIEGRWWQSMNSPSFHKNLTPVIRIDSCHSHSRTECDPNGIKQHDSGAKLDAEKPMAGRLLGMFGNALMSVAEVGTFGAKKYTEGGWQHVEDGFKRYDDAGMRHFLKRGMGEEFDEDSELPHLAHEAWNALAKLELYLRDKKQAK